MDKSSEDFYNNSNFLFILPCIFRSTKLETRIFLYINLHSPQYYDVLQKRKEDEDDAGAHPNIQSRNVTYSWCTLSETKNIIYMSRSYLMKETMV